MLQREIKQLSEKLFKKNGGLPDIRRGRRSLQEIEGGTCGMLNLLVQLYREIQTLQLVACTIILVSSTSFRSQKRRRHFSPECVCTGNQTKQYVFGLEDSAPYCCFLLDLKNTCTHYIYLNGNGNGQHFTKEKPKII
jgi:hypothetical protein